MTGVEVLMDIPPNVTKGWPEDRRAMAVRMRTSGLWMKPRWVKRESRIDLGFAAEIAGIPGVRLSRAKSRRCGQ